MTKSEVMQEVIKALSQNFPGHTFIIVSKDPGSISGNIVTNEPEAVTNQILKGLGKDVEVRENINPFNLKK